MINVIVLKEIQEYLTSFKFMLGLVITLVLIVVSTLLNLNDYKQRLSDYSAARAESKADGVSFVTVYREPEILSVLIEGNDRKFGNQLTLAYNDLPYGATGYMGSYRSRHGSVTAGFEAVDFNFVVRVVLSLLAIFLAYNAISEEKVSGTLKLALSNSLPRDKYLLGKFLGGGIVLLCALTVATLFAILVLVADSEVMLDAHDWMRVIALYTASVVYLAGFYTLSLFVSVLFSRPATCLIVLLQCWIVLLFIYPNLSNILARKIAKLPGQEEISARKEAGSEDYEKEYRSISVAINQARRNGETPSDKMKNRLDEIQIQQAEFEYRVDRDAGNQYSRQARLSRNLSLLSPAVAYDNLVRRLAHTGNDQYEQFLEAAYRHWQAMVERIRMRQKTSSDDGGSDLTEFYYTGESLAESFRATTHYVLILFLFGAVFFSLAYTSFLRKDVR